jgi:hypothetical protein
MGTWSHPGQRAEVDLGEAQIGDRGEGGVEVQVPKADGGTSQPGVNHPRRRPSGGVVTMTTLRRRLLTVKCQQKYSADC